MFSWFHRPKTAVKKTYRPLRRYRPFLESLEDRRLLTAPVIDTITDVTLPAGKTINVPITATDTDGNALTYSVSSSNGAITAQVRQNTQYLKLTVTGIPGGPADLVFQLFQDADPNTVAQIIAFVNSGTYTNKPFYRIDPNFVIQGGPNSPPGAGFDDEFANPAAPYIAGGGQPDIYTANGGQIGLANSGKDTNVPDFFITIDPRLTANPTSARNTQRNIDFNNGIFGQLVRGSAVIQAIAGQPASTVTITSASIIPDTTDAVLTITAGAGTPTSTITVTANDGLGGTSTQTFHATAAADTINDPPILGPVSNMTTNQDTPLNFTLTARDIDSGSFEFKANVTDAVANATVSLNTSTGAVTVTPNSGFTGQIHLLVGVKQAGASVRGSTIPPQDIFDTEAITVTVSAVNQHFVARVFRDALHREISAAGLAFFEGQLASGKMTRDQFVQGVLHSAEYRNIVVNDMYVKLLNRGADPTGFQVGTSFLAAGGTAEQLEAAILASNEFFVNSGGTNTGFLNAVYSDLFNRAIDPTGSADHGRFLAAGGSRLFLAQQILKSPEADRDEILGNGPGGNDPGLISRFLHRGIGLAEFNVFFNFLHDQQQANERAIAILLASQEYFNRG